MYIERDFRYTEETISVRTDDDEVELAYYFFSKDYAEKHQNQVAYLLQDNWQLPQGHMSASYESPVKINTLQPISSEDEGITYILYFAPYATESFDEIKPWVIQGVRLPHFQRYLKKVQPEPIIHKRHNMLDGWYNWNENWPLELFIASINGERAR